MAALNLNEARHRHAAVKQYPNPANFEEFRMLAFSPPSPTSLFDEDWFKQANVEFLTAAALWNPANEPPACAIPVGSQPIKRATKLNHLPARLPPMALVCVLSGGAEKRTSGKRTKEGPSGHIKRRRRSPLGPPKPVSAPRSLPPRSRRLIPRPRGMVPRPRRLSLRPSRLSRGLKLLGVGSNHARGVLIFSLWPRSLSSPGTRPPGAWPTLFHPSMRRRGSVLFDRRVFGNGRRGFRDKINWFFFFSPLFVQ
jgi:hypothetical protein